MNMKFTDKLERVSKELENLGIKFKVEQMRNFNDKLVPCIEVSVSREDISKVLYLDCDSNTEKPDWLGKTKVFVFGDLYK